MKLIESDSSISQIKLMTPNSLGYVVVSAQIDPGSVATNVEQARNARTGLGEESASPAREELHRNTEGLRSTIAFLGGVHTASLFEAILFHGGTLDEHPAHGRQGARVARYDTLFIVKTESIPAAERLASDPAFQELIAKLHGADGAPNVLVAGNVKRAGDVDRTHKGVFLVNYFFADDIKGLLDVWDYTAGWWETKGKMANSELLLPTEASDSDYSIVNTARWDDLAPALEAFSNPGLKTYVLANIEANQATTMPSLYRLVA